MGDLRASTVDGVVRRSAGRTPDRVAQTFADRSWTYAELDAAVSRAAAHLLSLGLDRGDRVATIGANSDAYLLAFLGCARAGLVHVPVNHALTGGELSYLLAQSGSRVALVDPALRDGVEAVRGETGLERVRTLHGDGDAVLAAWRDGPVPAIDVDVADTDLVQLLYTSGTRSKPKGAMMTHRALVHEYVSTVHALDLAETDDPLHCMPLYHSAGMHVFLLPYLAVGATNRLMARPDVPEILRLIEAERAGALFLAPTVWVPLSNADEFATRDLSSLRKAFYGASIMPVPVLQRLRKRLPDLAFYNCFGQSEIAPLATVLRPEEHEQRPESCGRPVLFVEIRVVDAEGDDVDADVPGELLYRSPQLCTGYWQDEAATAEVPKRVHFVAELPRNQSGKLLKRVLRDQL